MNLDFVKILMKKELLQIKKDKSVLLIVFLLPIMLIIIYGFALRMDIKPVKLAIVQSSSSALQTQILNDFLGSSYYEITTKKTLQEAKNLLRNQDVDGILYFKSDFDQKFSIGKAEILLLQNGSQAQLAEISVNYSKELILSSLSKFFKNQNLSSQGVKISSRLWFNEANESSWFLVSGQYAAVVTLMSIFIGCLVIAREWDRGTMQPLANTNASAFEIVFAKVFVYFLLALWGSAIMLIVGELTLFIPIRGNIFMLLLTLAILALEMVTFGVLISAVTKNQFLAQEYAIVFGFLPAVLLSGLIFDLRGLPWFIQVIGYVLPPTYVIDSLRIIFLSGGDIMRLIINFLIQLFATIIFFYASVYLVKRDAK